MISNIMQILATDGTPEVKQIQHRASTDAKHLTFKVSKIAQPQWPHGLFSGHHSHVFIQFWAHDRQNSAPQNSFPLIN